MRLTNIEISEQDSKVLLNDLEDVDRWVRGAIMGKVANCRKRLLEEWTPKLMADPTVKDMPADQSRLIDLILSRDDYQNRADREAQIVG
tara:strand:+ start:295 stop:561 length:267 start_codon:yes stop_codon:yes gene_type:complete